MKNGSELLIKTVDNSHHKVNILDIHKFEILNEKKGLTFLIKNFNSYYMISTENHPYINLEIIDRVVWGICIQTKEIDKRILPKHLRPIKTTILYPNSIDSSIWTLRWIKTWTIYKQGEITYMTRELNMWEELKKAGLPIMNEEKFYKTFWISRGDALDSLKASS